MGNASTSVVWGHCRAGLVMHRSVRPVLTGGVTVASAGILVVSLVAAPPDVNGAKTDVGAVQLAAVALPPAASPAAILEKFRSNQAQTVVPVAPVLVGGAANAATPDVTIRPTFRLAGQSTGFPTQAIPATALLGIDPATIPQRVNSAAQAGTIPPGPLTWISAALVGGFLYFVVIPAFLVVIYVTSAINVVLGFLGLPLLPNVPDPPFGPTPQINATTAPAVGTNPLLANSAAVDPHTAATAAEASDSGIGKTDVSGQATVRQMTTVTEQPTPTQEPATVNSIADGPAVKGTEAAQENVVATTPTPTNAAQPSAERSDGASTSELAKPGGRSTTSRPVVGVGVFDQQNRGLLHRGDVDHPISHTAGDGDREPAGPSSTASSSAGSSSTGNTSKGGSADGHADNS